MAFKHRATKQPDLATMDTAAKALLMHDESVRRTKPGTKHVFAEAWPGGVPVWLPGAEEGLERR